MIRNRAVYREHDIDKPFNVMLTGPAGTGKTKLAGYLAKRLNVPLIQASASALESGYIGGGSKALHALHRKACARGSCIIFLDEAQGLFMPRGRGDKKWEDDTANTLLGLLDGVRSDQGAGVIWVVASNFDDASSQMDEAMLRRFSVKINFRLPNKSERRELLRAFLARKADGCVAWDQLNLDQVAEITANLSPALLQTVVERASMIAIQEQAVIDTGLMFRAFERATIGLTDRATTAEKTRQRERVALHELGHFFMQIDPWLPPGHDAGAGQGTLAAAQDQHRVGVQAGRAGLCAVGLGRRGAAHAGRAGARRGSSCMAAWRRRNCSTARAASRSAARTISRKPPRCWT